MHGRPVLRLYLTRCCVCSTQLLRLLLQLLMVFFTVPPPPHHAATVREHDVYRNITTHAGLVLATRVPVPCNRQFSASRLEHLCVLTMKWHHARQRLEL